MSLAALVFSGGSLWISFCAFRSTRSYQHFEYTPRLQISGGAVYFGANTAPSYGFKGGLQNKGAKPVRIRRLLMDVGHCALAVAYAAWMTAVIVEFVRGGPHRSAQCVQTCDEAVLAFMPRYALTLRRSR